MYNIFDNVYIDSLIILENACLLFRIIKINTISELMLVCHECHQSFQIQASD